MDLLNLLVGGMYNAPHGAVCARLLPFVMQENIIALRKRDPNSVYLLSYEEIANLVTCDNAPRAEDCIG